MKTQNTSGPRSSIFKRLGMGAFGISLLVHGLFALLAVVFLYKWIYPPKEAEALVFTPQGNPGSSAEVLVKVKNQQQTVSVSNIPPVRVQVPEFSDIGLTQSATDITDSALPGTTVKPGANRPVEGPGFPGTGPNIPKMNGPTEVGIKFNGPFGERIATDGAMPGRFYDFKQMPNGKPTEGYQTNRNGDFASRVIKIQESGFEERAFKKFYQAPDTLFLSQLAVPSSDANAGPKFFNVADKVKPSGWFVHYQGTVSSNRDITFRFVGTGDDYIGVFSRNRPRLIAAWPMLRTQISGRWEPSEPIDDNAATPFPGGPLAKGDWIKLKKGELLDLDIGIGECPGGKVGFVLMVEEKGVKYPTASNGAKVLPLFTTAPITQSTRERVIKDFPNWEFNWENVPVFGVDKTSGTGWKF